MKTALLTGLACCAMLLTLETQAEAGGPPRYRGGLQYRGGIQYQSNYGYQPNYHWRSNPLPMYSAPSNYFGLTYGSGPVYRTYPYGAGYGYGNYYNGYYGGGFGGGYGYRRW